MAGNEFKYDPEKLSYEQVETNLKGRVLRITARITASLFLAVVLIILVSFFFDTPGESKVRQENADLKKDYELLREKYSTVNTVLEELQDKDENIYKAIFETEPLSGQEYYEGLSSDYNYLLKLSNNLIVDSTALKVNEVLEHTRLSVSAYDNLMKNAAKREKMLNNLPGIQPISNPDLTRLASGYGNRMHPMYKIVKFHEGMDFTAPTGTEVFATGSGKVEDLDHTRRGHGNTVIIDHGFGYKTVYSHLDKFNVRKGQKVKRGDIIGYVGNTGLSVAPHLHYEVRLHGKAVNPVNYYFLDLLPEEYYKMIELSVKSGQSFD